MKILLRIMLFLCAIVVIIAIKFNNEKPKPPVTVNDITPFQEFASTRFADYISSLGATDFELRGASYAHRVGDLTRFICQFEARVTLADGTEENLAYGYFIEANDEGGFEVTREGADIDHKMLT